MVRDPVLATGVHRLCGGKAKPGGQLAGDGIERLGRRPAPADR
jgi:hypothetical protein